MNKEAQTARIKVTNEIVQHLVSQGYEFFSNVYLHTDYHERSPRHPVKAGSELWSDSMFFTVPGKAIILRVTLSYKGEIPKDRIVLSFRLLAAAKPLEQLNKIAREQQLEFRSIPMDKQELDHFVQPLIPVFVAESNPQGFSTRDRVNWFGEDQDDWVIGDQGERVAVPVPQIDSSSIKSLTTWLAPMIPYVKDGKLQIPERSGITKDPMFLRSESVMREHLNTRALREIANFGHYL